jgi:accessory gene regulator B
MVRRISENLASEMISAGVIKDEERDVYQYSIEVSITMLVNFISSLALFLIFDRLVEGLIFTAAYMPLRIYSGGYHASTQLRCSILSMVLLMAIIGIIAVIPKESLYFGAVILALVSSLVIFILTPVGSFNKLLDELETSVNRKRSLRIMAAEGAALIALLIFGLELQAFIIGIGMVAVAAALVIGELELIADAGRNT